jgi:hypothetical protein
MKHFLGILVTSTALVMSCCAAGARGQTAAVSVELTPAVCGTDLYDPRMPSKLMPTPAAGELGVTVADFSCKANVTGGVMLQFPSGSDVVAAVRVESVHLVLKLNVTEWVDYAAGPKIMAHEDGHAMIARHFYDQSDQVAAAIAQRLIGKDFYGSGPDAQAAATDALNVAAKQIAREYLGRVRDPSEMVQNFYDRITEHGGNSIDEIDAIERAMHWMSQFAGK